MPEVQREDGVEGDDESGLLFTLPSTKLLFEPCQSYGPFNSRLKLINVSERKRLSFKFKYCARSCRFGVSPNVGVLHPKEVVDVKVTVHQSDEAVKWPLKIRILYIVLPKEDVNLKSLWKSLFDKIYTTELECLLLDSALHHREPRPLVKYIPRKRKKSRESRELDDFVSHVKGLNQTHLYFMMAIFILGFIMGKWII